MVHIYLANCCSDQFRNRIGDYIQHLPEPLRRKVQSFKQKKDSYRFLLGKILLKKGLEKLGYSSLTLDCLQFSKYNRPYISNDLDFNISHSGDYVLCVLSKKCRVGIDIEELNNINFSHFLQCFTKREWARINNSVNPLRMFYQLWTRKEAVLKADGKGLQVPLLSFEAICNKVNMDKNQWYIRELAISEGYASSLATDIEIIDNYSIQKIFS